MNILITGASGFIGSGLVNLFFMEKNVRILALSRVPKQSNNNISYITGDILNEEFINSVFSQNNIDAVIHLAAITAHSEIVDNKFKTFDVNLRGTENLLKAKLRCFVNTKKLQV